MYSIIIFTLFTAFYLCYNTSQKMSVSYQQNILLHLKRNKKLSYTISIFLFSIAFISSLYFWGIGSGAFAYFAVLMGVGCVIVLIAPFGFIKLHHGLLIFICLLILEITL